MHVISLLGMSKVIQTPMLKIWEWMDTFKAYIPTKTIDQIIYFEIEAVEVLTFIKEKLEEKYDLMEIRQLLGKTFLKSWEMLS
ncbi:hypothetical protein [Oceanobacillus sp. J11TS1]|uniref:hypothetical protein n=1 Tax=Oceanobacillus sp. J11TS1 TaxID=2807191 RepID=UPI001B0A30C8|nr:hypothetical protein [Oceanobacillus sp. J11TS1]GIO25013.1 hypothetical protein J11TS1_35940 [Oceanobacillus sp. J11TS1]